MLYEKEVICCFNHLKKIFLPYQNETIAIAVSGGVDSMVLLTMMVQVHGAQNVFCITVDHKLRNDSSDNAKFVKNFCDKIDVKCQILEWYHDDIKSGIQEKARAARYDMMLNFCKFNSIKILCLAHHLNDQIETFVMRLRKNSGRYGLACMFEKRIIKISNNFYINSDFDNNFNFRNMNSDFDLLLMRPLLKFSKKFLIEFANKNNLIWFEDSSNKNVAFERVRIRNELFDGNDAILQAKVARITKIIDHCQCRRVFFEKIASSIFDSVTKIIDLSQINKIYHKNPHVNAFLKQSILLRAHKICVINFNPLFNDKFKRNNLKNDNATEYSFLDYDLQKSYIGYDHLMKDEVQKIFIHKIIEEIYGQHWLYKKKDFDKIIRFCFANITFDEINLDKMRHFSDNKNSINDTSKDIFITHEQVEGLADYEALNKVDVNDVCTMATQGYQDFFHGFEGKSFDKIDTYLFAGCIWIRYKHLLIVFQRLTYSQIHSMQSKFIKSQLIFLQYNTHSSLHKHISFDDYNMHNLFSNDNAFLRYIDLQSYIKRCFANVSFGDKYHESSNLDMHFVKMPKFVFEKYLHLRKIGAIEDDSAAHDFFLHYDILDDALDFALPNALSRYVKRLFLSHYDCIYINHNVAGIFLM